jgi:hypothetical protein
MQKRPMRLLVASTRRLFTEVAAVGCQTDTIGSAIWMDKVGRIALFVAEKEKLAMKTCAPSQT